LQGTPPELEDATRAFAQRAEGSAHLGALSFNEAKLAPELAVYLRDTLLPVLKTQPGMTEAVRLGEAYVSAVATSTTSAPSLISVPTTPTKQALTTVLLDQDVWGVLVQEVLIRALQRFSQQRKREWTDYWMGRQTVLGLDSLKTTPPLHNRLPRDLSATPNPDSARAMTLLYRAGFACLVLYWRYEPASRSYLERPMPKLRTAAEANAHFDADRLLRDGLARVALEQTLRESLLALRDYLEFVRAVEIEIEPGADAG
jgi:hypothetical protein